MMKSHILRAILGIMLLALLLSGASCGPKLAVKYTLTIAMQGSGTVTPVSGTKYDAGTVVTLTATPAAGWILSSWEGPNGPNVGASNKIVMDGNKVIMAVFEPTYPLTVSVVGEGTVTERLIGTDRSLFEHGAEVELTAHPAEGWKFVEWQGDVTPGVNPLIAKVTVTQATTVSALFAELLKAPTGLKVEVALSTDPNSVVAQLSWEPNTQSTFSHYRLLMSKQSQKVGGYYYLKSAETLGTNSTVITTGSSNPAVGAVSEYWGAGTIADDGYYIAIDAVDIYGASSGYCEPTLLLLQDPTIPQAPTWATPAHTIDGDEATLRFNAVTTNTDGSPFKDIGGYFFTSAGLDARQDFVSTSVTDGIVSALCKPGEAMGGSVRIVAYDTHGRSSLSEWISIE